MSKFLVFFGYYNYPYVEDLEDNLSEILEDVEEDGFFMYEKYPSLFCSKSERYVGIPIYYGENISLENFKSHLTLEKFKDLSREFYCFLSEDGIRYYEDKEPQINVIKIN